MSRYPVLAASAVVLALTLFLTWPQALHLGTKIPPHNDAYFSMWRLGWIAHALRVNPPHLYDANIYYPERRTLAYSDAIILEGVVAAPLIWSGLSPVLVYNLLFLGGIVLSGIGMFVLARYLTGRTSAALVSAAIFTLLPYRVEHYMHLELQWTMWMPLAFWALHRAVSEPSWRFGVLCGVFVWLQLISSVYYGIFLAIIVAILGALLVATGRTRVASVPPLVLGGVVALALAGPYLWPYLENARTLGPRDFIEVSSFSARPLSYATAPYANWPWGWTADRFGGEELRITPGIMATAFAVIGVVGWRSRLAWLYGFVCILAAELSLGPNGVAYAWLLAHAPPGFGGLRAIARFSILVFCALAVLAGFGVRYLQERFVARRAREWVAATAIILIALECGSAPMLLWEVPPSAPVYRVLAQLPRGVVAEFPMAQPFRIPGFDPDYQYWSMQHWNPLINGYSGYAPARYLETLRRLVTFPDDGSIAHLKELNVRYILVHEKLYLKRSQFANLLLEMARRNELVPNGMYKDWAGDTALFELK